LSTVGAWHNCARTAITNERTDIEKATHTKIGARGLMEMVFGMCFSVLRVSGDEAN